MTTDLNGFRKDREGAFIVKDPQSTLDYSIDWQDWLENSDNITNSTWTISTFTDDENPIEEETSAYVNGVATILLSGGTDGKIYRITNTITTANDLIDERYFRIVVKNKSA
jgi:hypothetical protein